MNTDQNMTGENTASSSGGKIKLIIGAVVLIVVLFGVVFFIRGTGNSSSMTKSDSVPTAVPSEVMVREESTNWLTYNDPKYGFSISYPDNYATQSSDLAIKRLGALGEIDFVPKDNKGVETDAIFLTVFANNPVNTPLGWVRENVTGKEKESTSSSGVNYKFYQAMDVVEATVGARPAVSFIQSFGDSPSQSETTVVSNGRYILLLTKTKGYVDNIYQKMLSSVGL